MRSVLVVVLASFALVSSQPMLATSPSGQRGARDPLVAKGRVTHVHSARLFTLQGDVAGESEVLVIPPHAVSISLVGSDVEVGGTLRRFTSGELGRTWTDMDDETRRAFRGRRVLVAASLIATAAGQPETEITSAAEVAPAVETEPQSARPPAQTTLHLMPTTLADFINDFAGQHVAIANARVVGVFEPGAFLIEPATDYQKGMDYRDRILVLVDSAALTVSPESIVSAVVSVDGIARTLSGLRLTAQTRWPSKLTPAAAQRLEVRAAILASSVRMPDGTELTNRGAVSR